MKKILFISLLAMTLLFTGCVETVTDTGDDLASSEITINSPVSKDSVKTGRNLIDYSADKTDIAYFEVLITNYDFSETFEVTNPDSTLNLYLDVDSTLLFKTINYKINGYAESGSVAAESEVMTGLYVKKNTDPPDAPDNLEIIRDGQNKVILTWTDNASNETNYVIYRKDGDAGIWRSIKSLPANTSSYADLNLSPYTIYYYKVAALNQYGVSQFTAEVSSLGTSSGAAPSNLNATALGATAVYLDWRNNADDGNLVVIQRKDGGETEFKDIDKVSASVDEYTDDSGLIANTTYVYRVATVTTTGITEWSNEATVVTKNVDVPAPSGLNAEFQQSSRRIAVTWNDNTTLESGTYIERRTGETGSFIQVGVTGADETIYYDSQISMENTYYYRARHLAVEGFYTRYSNIDSAYYPKLPPDAPSDLSVTDFGGGKFGLIWTDNSVDEDGFELQRKVQAGTYSVYQVFGPNKIAFNDNVPDTTKIYFYRVRAFRDSDTSAFSNEASTAGGTGNIIAPTNLQGVVVEGELKVDLSWQDNSDNELGFQIERKYEGGSYSQIDRVGPGRTAFTDNTVQRGTTYIYRIRAYNGDGFSAYSNEITIQIPF